MAVHYSIDYLPGFSNAVITIGTFDGVHRGHMAILDRVVKHAREVKGESILLTFEPHPRKILFPEQPLKLLTPLDKKLELVTAAGIQHIVVVPFTKEFAALTAEEYVRDFLVKLFKPESIVIGYDHHFGNDRSGNIHLLKEMQTGYGYKIFEIPAQLIDEAAVSSTKIRNAITEGHVEEATEMMGHNYTLKGTVRQGAQLGRSIDYPTANIQPADADQLIPGRGVYAVRIRHDNELYKGMLNIGYRPTVSSDIQLHIEANIFDFNKDVYAQQLEIIFVARLRDEQKFPSLDALKEQLAKDKEAALGYL